MRWHDYGILGLTIAWIERLIFYGHFKESNMKTNIKFIIITLCWFMDLEFSLINDRKLYFKKFRVDKIKKKVLVIYEL